MDLIIFLLIIGVINYLFLNICYLSLRRKKIITKIDLFKHLTLTVIGTTAFTFIRFSMPLDIPIFNIGSGVHLFNIGNIRIFSPSLFSLFILFLYNFLISKIIVKTNIKQSIFVGVILGIINLPTIHFLIMILIVLPLLGRNFSM